MRRYNQMTIWANKRARQDLSEFRNLVVEYFNNAISRGVLGNEINENATAMQCRQKINLMSNRVAEWAAATGHDSGVVYREAPMLGGRVYSVHLIHNVFSLVDFQISPSKLIDTLEKAIGVYSDDARRAVIRIFNPLFWLGRIFDWVSSIPFMFLSVFGVNQDKAEANIIGRFVKGVLYSIQVIAAFLAIADKLGFLENVKKICGR